MPSSGALTGSAPRLSGRPSPTAARGSSLPTSTRGCSSTTPLSSGSTAATPAAAPSTTTTTGPTPRRCAAARRSPRATTTAMGRTRWARWSARTPACAESDRRRPGRQVDRRQGVRVELVLGLGSARLRAVDPGSDGPRGQNPRPDLRPHIVNNSWGGGGGDPWYQATVNAWVAAGIFPAFSNGNAGPGCGSSGSPGDYTNSYSAGAFDINNAIAGFSSRGASAFGGLKPNIAAPGVNVRSSVPDELVRGVQRHVHGLAARGRHRRAHLVGDTGPTGEHRGDGGADSTPLPSTRRTRPAAARPPTTTSGARASSTPSRPSSGRRLLRHRHLHLHRHRHLHHHRHHHRHLRRHRRHRRHRRRHHLRPHRRPAVACRTCSACGWQRPRHGSGRGAAESARCAGFAPGVSAVCSVRAPGAAQYALSISGSTC